MKILILEDDELIADLLETIVLGLYPRGHTTLVASLHEALSDWKPKQTTLIICDWNLPDGSGLDFVRHVRREDPDVPIVMISGRSDRQSVLTAAKHHINGFITKPFSVEMVHQRLRELLPAELENKYGIGGPDKLFAEAMDGQVLLPTSLDPADVLALMHRDEMLSVSQLAERWRDDKSLVTRLLDVANGSSYRRTGEPVSSLKASIHTLGVKMALNLGLSMALDRAHELSDPRLQSLGRFYGALSDKLAAEASRMARQVGDDPVMYYTAGILGRIGELAALSVLQQYLILGGSVADDEIDVLVRQWAQSLGNRLKVQWRLPLQLRELVGAIHHLPRGSTQQSRLIMRAASLYTDGAWQSQDYYTLMRRIGLPPVKPDETITPPESDQKV